MRYLLSFLSEVEEDAVYAYIWYEEKSKGLGEEFLRAFYASAAEISRTPPIFIPRSIKTFIVNSLSDSLMLSIFLLRMEPLWFTACSIAPGIRIQYKERLMIGLLNYAKEIRMRVDLKDLQAIDSRLEKQQKQMVAVPISLHRKIGSFSTIFPQSH